MNRLLLAALLLVPFSWTTAAAQPAPPKVKKIDYTQIALKTELVQQAIAVEYGNAQLKHLFSDFVMSVYAPFCSKYGGFSAAGIDYTTGVAWPALIKCNHATLRAYGPNDVHVERAY